MNFYFFYLQLQWDITLRTLRKIVFFELDKRYIAGVKIQLETIEEVF